MLIVDDEPEILLAMVDALEDEFVVLKTDSPRAALELVEREKDIAVIVSDQCMPYMSGDEFLAECRRSSDATRILLTGFADLRAVVRAVNDGGIFAYIGKPWQPDELGLVVKKAAEHYRMARRLEAQRLLLGSIMDDMTEAVVALDTEGEVVLFNRSAKELFGMEARTVPLASWARTYGLYLPDGRTYVPQDDNPLIRATRGERSAEVELIVRNDTVPDRVVRVTGTPLHARSDTVTGGLAVLRDVTDQRLLEEQLQRAQRMEAIGRLAGGIAHDFNNILAIIASYASLVDENLPEQDTSRADIRHILEATGRAASLTSQLLAFSRRKSAEPEVVDLNVVIAGVEDMLRRVLPETVTFVTNLSSLLGRVRVDVGQVEQVLLNLVINARDAMPYGGRLTIETRHATTADLRPLGLDGSRDSFAALSVVDTGSGMDSETRSRIFEPFFTTKPVGRGTGLGLSTVHGIVRHAGGHVVVHSEVGSGTRFDLLFPCVECAARTPPPPPPPPSVGRSLVPATILVVEDDAILRRALGRILRDSGFDVVDADSAPRALQAAESWAGRIDLLLTDVVMPGANGVTLADELRRRDPELRVLLMSGYFGDRPPGVDGPAIRAQQVLDKPFTPRELRQRVHEALRLGSLGGD